MPSVSVAPALETYLSKGSSAEIENRRELRGLLDFADRPVEQRGGLYKSLNKLLESGNDRFVLYCPLYLIPAVDWYRQYDEAVDAFSELFIQSWFRLLRVHDIRANFVDGDVPDIELAVDDFDMVVQAAYLTPTLVERGLIHRSQLPTDDPVLTRSLEDAFMQLRVESDYIFNRSRPFRDSVAAGLRYTPPDGVSEKRAKWLVWESRRRTIAAMANTVGRWLCNGQDFESLGDLDGDSAEVALLSIGSGIERAWFQDRAKATAMFSRFRSELERFGRHYDLSGMLGRLCNLGLIRESVLDEFGLFLPNLAGPLHGNLKPIVKERALLRNTLSRDSLVNVIYPAAIVYGSRLKGYGGKDADIDIAVFVKPGNDPSQVSEVLQHEFNEPVTQYWLEEDGDDLRVRDFERLAANIGDSTNTHVLFCGAWEGDRDTISMLHERLLSPYLREQNERVRDVWLGEIERDLLQYRLLHRGYERYHFTIPPTFLDDGYRMTAAKLFASHVFLPRRI